MGMGGPAEEVILLCPLTVPSELGEVKNFKGHGLGPEDITVERTQALCLNLQESSNFSYEEPDRRYLSLCRPYADYIKYSSLLYFVCLLKFLKNINRNHF